MRTNDSARPGLASALVASAVLLGVILLLYGPVLGGYLRDDDFAWLSGAQRFQLASAFRISSRHFYRPLIDVYFGVAMWMFGYSARVFHALNLSLHVVNACLLFLIAARLVATRGQALAAALVFAVLPAITDGVAWVSAVTALLMSTFYLATMLAHLTWLETGSRAARITSIVAFIGALLSHEGAVTLLPMIVLAQRFLPSASARPWRLDLRRYAPFAAVLAAYLAVSFLVNRSNYVVTEGYYRPGLHVLINVLQYVTSLYLGQRGPWWFAITAAGIAAIVWRGSRIARFGALWMLVVLLPYCFFVWGNTGRYMYLAAAGFSLMTVELIWSWSRGLASRTSPARAGVVAWVIVAIVAGRFAAFTRHGMRGAAAAGEPYRAWMQSFRLAHETLPDRTMIGVAEPQDRRIDPRSIAPMLRLEYDVPYLEIRLLRAGPNVGASEGSR